MELRNKKIYLEKKEQKEMANKFEEAYSRIKQVKDYETGAENDFARGIDFGLQMAVNIMTAIKEEENE